MHFRNDPGSARRWSPPRCSVTPSRTESTGHHSGSERRWKRAPSAPSGLPRGWSSRNGGGPMRESPHRRRAAIIVAGLLAAGALATAPVVVLGQFEGVEVNVL